MNLYIGSTVTLENAAGTDVEMVQQTDYPWSGKITITVNPKVRKSFAVRLRVPNRTTSKLYTPSPEVNGITSLAVNGKPVKPVVEKGYAVITRAWKAGDKIELELPMRVQRVTSIEQIAPARGKVALRYGPLIYNVEKVDQDITKALAPNSVLNAQWRGDLLGGVTIITGEYTDGSRLMAVPNYARLNRDKQLPPEAGPISGDPSLYMGPSARRPETLQAESQEESRRPPAPASIVWIRRG